MFGITIKSKCIFHIILLSIAFTGCNDEVESLKYRVEVSETELREVRSELEELQRELTELKIEWKSNSEFEKEMECQALLDRLKDRWDNVTGCYYSSHFNTCMVKYKDEHGVIKESRVESMADRD